MKWQVALKHDVRTRKAEVDIYDVIGDPWMGTTAFSMLYQLRSLDVDDLLVRVNSVGGSVSDGMDIYNLLREHPARSKVCRISGCAASIATVIALGCQKVEMHENSQWMVHEARASFDMGAPAMLAADLARMAGVLEKTNEQMMAIYALKTGKSQLELARVCAAETWFTAEEAKAFGFVDEVIGLADQASMMVSASAWTPAVIGKLHSFPAPLLAVARAAQLPPAVAEPSSANTPPAPATDLEEDPMTILKKTEFLSKVGAVMASVTSLQTDLAKMGDSITAANVEAKSKDLEKLSEEVKEMSNRAKSAEAELAKMSESAAEYEESKARAEDAEKQLEDLKKKLATLKGEEEGNPFGDDEEDDEEDADARALLKTMSRAQARSIVLAAIAATGVAKSASALEVAVMGMSRGEKPVNAKDIRKAKVDQMITGGQLAPHQRGWAMKTSDETLAEYVKELGGRRVGPGAAEHQPNEPEARRLQRVIAEEDVVLTADEKKQCFQAGVPEATYLAKKKADLLALSNASIRN